MKAFLDNIIEGKDIYFNIPSGDFEITLAEGETRNCYFVQAYASEEAVTVDFKITLAEDAHLNLVIMSLSGKSIVNNFTAEVSGVHSECNLSGMYLVDGSRLVENNIVLNHSVAECCSNQLFKGIVDDNGVSKFYGLIKVAPDSQKIEAFQANHNLLLSDDAKAFTKPQLEIYADDVKCSHGATIGRLDEEQSFYLRSRGIDETTTKALLQNAFVAEVIDKISNPNLKETIQNIILEQFLTTTLPR